MNLLDEGRQKPAWKLGQFFEDVRKWEQALACNDCHTKAGGRLASLTGFYMPGRDSYLWLSQLGWAAVALTLFGVLVHLAIRVVARMRGR